MRVVLDTNILISALITPGGSSARIVDAWLKGRFVLVTHGRQIEELRDVCRRSKINARAKRAAIGRLINRIAARAEKPARLPTVQRSPDPDDDLLLALCEAGNADRLVTGDKADLLALKRHGPATILTAAAFAAELAIYAPPVR